MLTCNEPFLLTKQEVYCYDFNILNVNQYEKTDDAMG